MADEKEVTIVIRGKNLSPEVFQQAREQISGLKKSTDDAGKSGETFGQKILGAKSVTSLFDDQVKHLVAGFTIASLLDKAVGALGSFVSNTISGASHLSDLNNKTGISVEMLQRMDYAGAQVGITLDQMTAGVNQLQKRLAGGDKDAVSALKQLHLSADSLLAMDPGAMFQEIAASVALIPDPATRTYVAMALLGKSGAEMLPLLVNNFDELASGAVIMSDKTVAGLDRVDDSIAKLERQVSAISGIVLEPVADALLRIGSMIERFSHLDVYGVATSFLGLSDQLEMVKAKGDGAFASIANGVRVADPAIFKLNDSSRGLAATSEDLTDKLREFDAANKSNEATISKAAQAVEAHRAAIAGLVDTMTGRRLNETIRDQSEALTLATKSGALNAYQLTQIAKSVEGYLQQGGKVPNNLLDIYRMQLQLSPALITSADGFMKIAMAAGSANASLSNFIPPLKNVVSVDIAKILDFGKLTPEQLHVSTPGENAAKAFSASFSSMLQVGLPTAIMGAIQGGGSVISAAGSTIGSTLLGKDGLSGYITGKVASKAMSESLGNVLTSILPGVGAMVGPAFSALVNKLFGSAGRDAVKDFAATFQGGFDGPNGLHAALNTLGDEGERLWIALTQGVGKNNPDQAAKVIQQIKDALDAQKAKEAEVAQAAADSAAAQVAAVDKVKDAIRAQLTELDQQRQSLMDSISNEAPEAVMGIVEAQTRAQIDAIDQQKSALQAQMDAQAAAGDAAVSQIKDTARQAFEATRDEWSQGFHVPIWYDAQNSPDGGRGYTQQYASGGIAEGRQVALLAERGRREIVGDEAFMARALAAAIDRRGGDSRSGVMGGGNLNLTINVDKEGGATLLSDDGALARRINRMFSGGQISVPITALASRPR